MLRAETESRNKSGVADGSGVAHVMPGSLVMGSREMGASLGIAQQRGSCVDESCTVSLSVTGGEGPVGLVEDESAVVVDCFSTAVVPEMPSQPTGADDGAYSSVAWDETEVKSQTRVGGSSDMGGLIGQYCDEQDVDQGYEDTEAGRFGEEVVVSKDAVELTMVSSPPRMEEEVTSKLSATSVSSGKGAQVTQRLFADHSSHTMVPRTTSVGEETVFGTSGEMQYLPLEVRGKVLEVEVIRVTEHQRKKLLCLRHLPLGCDVYFVELDMKGVVGTGVFDKYRVDLAARAKRRKARLRAMQRERREEELEK